MLSLIQRVTSASVAVDDAVIGAIGPGLLALVAVEPGDTEAQFARMAQRLLGYRVFDDGNGRMNRSLAEAGGGPAAGQPVHPGRGHPQRDAAGFSAPRRRPPKPNAGLTGWSNCAGKCMPRGWKPAVSGPIW